MRNTLTRHETQSGGLLEKLRRIGESLFALARSHAELFAVELQDEKLRLLNLLVWSGVALTLGVAGLLVAIGTLAMWLWDAGGYLGLIGLTLVSLAGAVALILSIRRRIQLGPTPFAETIDEFRKDAACLRKDK